MSEIVELPMFPLGSVLFPAMPLTLRVFEERYLAMLATVLAEEPSEFGVVLIERGQEVGGGEHRFDVGTIAQIRELDGAEGFVVLIARGTRRLRVIEWLPDDPYPRALVEVLDDFAWDETLAAERDRVEQVVRRTLAVGAEFGNETSPVEYSATVELDADPVDAAWQLAGITPLNELDQMRLLGAESLSELLATLEPLAEEAAATFSAVADDDEPFPA
ncbi:MAG TPA: LON peptidase substrate-binding domain-containing protein [Pseudolysinimonas sp.]|nr:LON peptidase substrate-binding domain-containing protein [Pseudolysinimonas sp.]